MQLIPITTRAVRPPQDDIDDLFNNRDIRDGDIVIVTSKIVSIWKGNSIPIESIEKRELILKEADCYWDIPGRKFPITIKHSAIIFSAGVDESNANGYYLTLPKDPWVCALQIRKIILDKYNLTDIGVVISDSHSLPMRYGTTGIALSCAGFTPVVNYKGTKDLFGREFVFETFNLADSLASASTIVGGEGNEACPIVIAREVPRVEFKGNVQQGELLVPYEQDMYKELLKPFIK